MECIKNIFNFKKDVLLIIIILFYSNRILFCVIITPVNNFKKINFKNFIKSCHIFVVVVFG